MRNQTSNGPASPTGAENTRATNHNQKEKGTITENPLITKERAKTNSGKTSRGKIRYKLYCRGA